MKNELERLVPQELVMLASVVRASMLVLNARLFTLLGMALSACLFGWVLWQPDWIRLAGAVAFAVLVYLPVQRMESQKNVRNVKEESSED